MVKEFIQLILEFQHYENEAFSSFLKIPFVRKNKSTVEIPELLSY
jgi:hypothetical protein